MIFGLSRASCSKPEMQSLALFLLCFLITTVSSRPPLPDCEVPANTVTFDLSELSGVWYINAIVNYGARVNAMKCARAEFVTRYNPLSGVEALNYNSNTTGDFTPDIYELDQSRYSKQIHLLNLREKNKELYYYPLKFNDKVFIVSVCFLTDGKRVAQPISVFTKSANQTQTYIKSELKSAGVDVKQSYFVPYENCYK